MILTAEQILGAQDLEEREVEVPEWGGAVRVRAFSKAQQQQMRKDSTVAGEVDAYLLEMMMFIHGVVEPQFTPDQYGALAAHNAGVIDRILKILLEISGLDAQAVEEAKRKFPAAT